MRRPSTIASTVLSLLLLTTSSGGCKKATAPRAQDDAVAMGSWQEWHTLAPLVTLASGHVDAQSLAVLREAAALLERAKPRSADRRLAAFDTGGSRHWIAVARATIAALYFSVCIRGVAWRLEDRDPKSPPTRTVDFDEDTRIMPGDVSVESMLVSLDAAVASDIPSLATQARIARARVTTFASQCAANDEVAELAQSVLDNDLATLAAEHHLTPDLAYVWGGLQMSRYSGAAALPFLRAARDGGFDDPSLAYMLAVVALEQRELEAADKHVREAIATFRELGRNDELAQALFVHAEVARAAKDDVTARKRYDTVLGVAPDHVGAMLGIIAMVAEGSGDQKAAVQLHEMLPRLLGSTALDAEAAKQAATNLEDLVLTIEEPQLVQIGKDALLHRIEAEPDPIRRGLRYFFAGTLEVRLREYERASGHGVLAREEFAAAQMDPPVDVQAFLDQLEGVN